MNNPMRWARLSMVILVALAGLYGCGRDNGTNPVASDGCPSGEIQGPDHDALIFKDDTIEFRYNGDDRVEGDLVRIIVTTPSEADTLWLEHYEDKIEVPAYIAGPWAFESWIKFDASSCEAIVHSGTFTVREPDPGECIAVLVPPTRIVEGELAQFTVNVLAGGPFESGYIQFDNGEETLIDFFNSSQFGFIFPSDGDWPYTGYFDLECGRVEIEGSVYVEAQPCEADLSVPNHMEAGGAYTLSIVGIEGGDFVSASFEFTWTGSGSSETVDFTDLHAPFTPTEGGDVEYQGVIVLTCGEVPVTGTEYVDPGDTEIRIRSRRTAQPSHLDNELWLEGARLLSIQNGVYHLREVHSGEELTNDYSTNDRWQLQSGLCEGIWEAWATYELDGVPSSTEPIRIYVWEGDDGIIVGPSGSPHVPDGEFIEPWFLTEALDSAPAEVLVVYSGYPEYNGWTFETLFEDPVVDGEGKVTAPPQYFPDFPGTTAKEMVYIFYIRTESGSRYITEGTHFFVDP